MLNANVANIFIKILKVGNLVELKEKTNLRSSFFCVLGENLGVGVQLKISELILKTLF